MNHAEHTLDGRGASEGVAVGSAFVHVPRALKPERACRARTILASVVGENKLDTTALPSQSISIKQRRLEQPTSLR